MAPKAPFQKILDLAGSFVAANQGNWDHAGWEELQADAAKLGYELNDEARRHLGNIIEGGKHFYLTPAAKPKRQPAKRKTSQ